LQPDDNIAFFRTATQAVGRNLQQRSLSALEVANDGPGSRSAGGHDAKTGRLCTMTAKESGRSSGRGFASMDAEKQREIARKGGRAVSRDRAHMAAIGRKGGLEVSKDRQHMAEIGRKGGEEVSQNTAHMAEIGRKGGEEVSQNTAHMAEIGRKGGEASHGGRKRQHMDGNGQDHEPRDDEELGEEEDL
jgi:general stress protein YciG